MISSPFRRTLLVAAGASGLGALSIAALAQAARSGPLPSMTEGPFYPDATWRDRDPSFADWDADLTQVRRAGQVLTARGEHLGLSLSVVDTRGRPLDNVDVEIWQCDVMAAYRHPRVRVAAERMDPGFQGYGAGRSDKAGEIRFRTIRPVAYPGRTPHIHVKLRHASIGEVTSQLFVDGEAGNERDFLWRGLSDAERAIAALRLQSAAGAEGLRWRAQHALVVAA
jgi:protocatechuate 3,4-dioxygenase, beta subunit